jgi:hypothetical protein
LNRDVAPTAALADFHKYPGGAVTRHNVDFTRATLPILGHDNQAATF